MSSQAVVVTKNPNGTYAIALGNLPLGDSFEYEQVIKMCKMFPNRQVVIK